MKEYLSKGAYYFLWLAGGVALSVGIGALTVLFIRFGIAKASTGEAAILTVPMTLSVLAVLFVGAFRSGYKDAKIDLKMLFIPLGIAFLLQIAISAIFTFPMLTTGPAYEVGRLLQAVTVGLRENEPVPGWCVLIMMPVFDLFYASASYFGLRAGVKKRLKNRDKLYHENSNQ